MGVSKNDHKWMEYYRLLQEFLQVKGRVPLRGEVYENVSLGNWFANQKAFYRSGMISDKRKRLLGELEIELKNVTRRDMDEQRWFENFQLFREFYLKEGVIPKQFTEYKGVRIADWFYAQKVKFRKGTLTEEKRKAFEGIGIDLGENLRERKWFYHFDLMKAYVQENGELPRFDTVYQGVRLGDWLTKQKHLFRNGELLVARGELLVALGVDFENDVVTVRDKKWNEKLDLLKEYVSIYGVLPEKGEVFRGVAIGKWFKEKVSDYESGELSEKRWRTLDGLIAKAERSKTVSGVLNNSKEHEEPFR